MVQGTQERAQDELTRLRDERDDALKALQEAQLDAKDLEAREEGWKAAVSRIPLTPAFYVLIASPYPPA